jgi:uncharacterized lipoprotein
MRQTTTDHKTIKEWGEKYGARPAVIEHPNAPDDVVGIRLDFPGISDELLLSPRQTQETSWDEFFKLFDEQGLAFVYETEPTGNDPTLWYKFEKLS